MKYLVQKKKKKKFGKTNINLANRASTYSIVDLAYSSRRRRNASEITYQMAARMVSFFPLLLRFMK
ncbi:hypothetical protein C5167_029644 [Papaver somniferum]|nr:hypothetical protein C5167_029644 [Papaver somniferum]